ncbi:hypothetical protein [Actinotalea sp. Marseille-Q4924]|uniref:hypothetical protein n=1 Tax=Actinotalea sp. Marseille-Q4924 TaxID=2866571 RepID=UPI001CE49E19|nr:hypothetical protein [Actinotalea sp. Marseille-Q4924]
MAGAHQEKVVAGLRRYWSTQQLTPDLLAQLPPLRRAVVRAAAPESFAAATVSAAMVLHAERCGTDRFGWIGDSRSLVLAHSAAAMAADLHVVPTRAHRDELNLVAGCDHLVIDTFRGALGTDRWVQQRILDLVRRARCVYVLAQAGQALADAPALRAEFGSYPVLDCRIPTPTTTGRAPRVELHGAG